MKSVVVSKVTKPSSVTKGVGVVRRRRGELPLQRLVTGARPVVPHVTEQSRQEVDQVLLPGGPVRAAVRVDPVELEPDVGSVQRLRQPVGGVVRGIGDVARVQAQQLDAAVDRLGVLPVDRRSRRARERTDVTELARLGERGPHCLRATVGHTRDRLVRRVAKDPVVVGNRLAEVPQLLVVRGVGVVEHHHHRAHGARGRQVVEDLLGSTEVEPVGGGNTGTRLQEERRVTLRALGRVTRWRPDQGRALRVPGPIGQRLDLSAGARRRVDEPPRRVTRNEEGAQERVGRDARAVRRVLDGLGVVGGELVVVQTGLQRAENTRPGVTSTGQPELRPGGGRAEVSLDDDLRDGAQLLLDVRRRDGERGVAVWGDVQPRRVRRCRLRREENRRGGDDAGGERRREPAAYAQTA